MCNNKMVQIQHAVVISSFLIITKMCNSYIIVGRNGIINKNRNNNNNNNYKSDIIGISAPGIATRHTILELVKVTGDNVIISNTNKNPNKKSASSSNNNNSSSRYQKPPTTTTSRPKRSKRKFEEQKSICMEISRNGKMGNSIKALELYEDSISHGLCNTRIMNSIIDACARTSPVQLDLAMDLFINRPTNIKPNVFTFGSLISVCSRSRNCELALEVLREMEEVYHIRPNGVVYSTAIAACSRAIPPNADQAMLLLDEVTSKKNDVQMNVVGYNAAISTLAKVGDWKKAIEILNKMQHEYNVSPDAVTYSTVMTACERAEQWEEVLHYASAMKKLHIPLDGIALTTVLHACQALGYADLALEYLNQMKHNSNNHHHPCKTNGRLRQGVKAPLLHPDHVAYCLAISACSKAGRIQDSIRLFQELNAMDKASVKALTAVIDGCSTIANHNLALQLLHSMYPKFGLKPTVVTYSSVLTACAAAVAKCDDANIIERENIIHTAYTLFHNISSSSDLTIHPNIITYNAMLQVYAEGYKLQECFDLFHQLEHDEINKPTIVTFGTLMSACERVGNVTASSIVFDLMKDYDHIQPNEIVYGAAISCCRKAKQPEKALELLNTMISSNLKPNIVTFNTAIVSLVDINNQLPITDHLLDKALHLYQTHLLKTPSSKKSKKVSNEAVPLQPNAQTYQILIRALSNAQRPKEAETILRHMMMSSSKQDNTNHKQLSNKPDVNLYTCIITAYERINQPTNSLRLLEEMRAIGYDFYDSKFLNELFKRMVKLVHWVGIRK